MRLILASASPRRAQILRDAGLRFETVRANVGERRKPGETARVLTRRLATAKARAVVDKLRNRAGEAIVIGADTIVEVQGELLGKPRSPQDARKMQDVFREAARARACNARHEPSSVASTRASAMSCAAISGVTAPMSS